MQKLSSNSTENPFNTRITIEEGSWISSILNVGAVVGPVIFGNLTDRIGRKNALIYASVPIMISYALMSFSKVISLFYLARFLSGISVGAICNLAPVYIGETVSSNNRGALSSCFAIFLSLGMLFSFCVGPYVSLKVFNLILAVFPGIFVIVFSLCAPESTYFFLQKGQYELAQKTLQRMRGNSINVEKELLEIQDQFKQVEYTSFFQLFKSKGLKKALTIELCLMIFEQFSGIMAVLYYSETIFKQAGVQLDSAVCSIFVGLVQLVASISTPLVIDRLGRKTLLQISAIGMVLSEAPLGTYGYLKENNYDVSSWSVLPIVCLLLFTLCYNFGYGPVPWIMMGELFPLNAKAYASLLSSSFSLAIAFLVGKYFQTMAAMIGMGGTFWLFTINCIISIPFTHYFVIETKGKTLRQIEKELEC